jgi:hypothetical protein
MGSPVVEIQAKMSPILRLKDSAAFILPPLPPFSTSIRMSWRVVYEPI